MPVILAFLLPLFLPLLPLVSVALLCLKSSHWIRIWIPIRGLGSGSVRFVLFSFYVVSFSLPPSLSLFSWSLPPIRQSIVLLFFYFFFGCLSMHEACSYLMNKLCGFVGFSLATCHNMIAVVLHHLPLHPPTRLFPMLPAPYPGDDNSLDV